MEKAWQNVKNALKTRLPTSSYRMWIEPVKFTSVDRDCLVLSCPNHFSKKWVEEHYRPAIENELSEQLGMPGRISIEVSGPVQAGRPPDAPPVSGLQLALPNFIVRAHSGRILRHDFTFDQFVVGGSNELAFSASLALASRKSNPPGSLFLLSNSGMGKTHLSQAVGHHILSEFPQERVYYITAEDFTNEMVQAFRHDAIDQFKKKYRDGCDVLLLEDVHYLSGKARTQVELSMTLDSLMEAGKKIIFSSCYLPVDIPKINAELRSRFSLALISKIDPPNFQTRVRILKKKSTTNGHHIPEVVTRYLAGELTEDVRQLESGLVGLTARASLLGDPIDLDMAQCVVQHICRRRKTVTIDRIKRLVCDAFKISVNVIESRSRKQSVVRPRQIAMYLARRFTDAPLTTIGKSFNRYHATALYAIGAVEKALKTERVIKEQVDLLCSKLESGIF